MTVSLTDLDATIKSELAKKSMIPVGSLKEQDPLMDCLKNVQPEEVTNLIQDDAKPAKKEQAK